MVHRITSIARSTQLAVSQSASRSSFRRLARRRGSIQLSAARYASVTSTIPRRSPSSMSSAPPKARTSSRGSSTQMALPKHIAYEIVARTVHALSVWLPALAPKNEPAIDAAPRIVPAPTRNPDSARSCSASALAVISKLSCSIDSAMSSFYRAPATVLALGPPSHPRPPGPRPPAVRRARDRRASTSPQRGRRDGALARAPRAIASQNSMPFGQIWLWNADLRDDPEVLAHTTTPRYTNYTFVSSYGAITYVITLREAHHPTLTAQAPAAADPARRHRRLPQHGHHPHDRRGR